MVCKLAADAGIDDFDVEIWNELTFGTSLLDINNYYDKNEPKTPRRPDFLNRGGNCWELARRTVEAVKRQYPRGALHLGLLQHDVLPLCDRQAAAGNRRAELSSLRHRHAQPARATSRTRTAPNSTWKASRRRSTSACPRAGPRRSCRPSASSGI